ncbi:MAG: hypothetical protein ACOCRK_11385 [bacterium]
MNNTSKKDLVYLDEGDQFIYENEKYEKISCKPFWYSNDPFEQTKNWCRRLSDGEKMLLFYDTKVIEVDNNE